MIYNLVVILLWLQEEASTVFIYSAILTGSSAVSFVGNNKLILKSI